MLNLNFTLRKFHDVKNWYQFLTALKAMVPIRHGFHINISHVFTKEIRSLSKVSKYDQEMPKSHTADQPTARLIKSHRTLTVTRHQEDC